MAELLGLATDELAANAESEYQAAYQDDYEILIRFPNQSSIAAAHFASHHPHIVDQYWKLMRKAIANSDGFSDEAYHRFCSITHRPFQIPQADAALEQVIQGNHSYNGVMFSGKWLAEDMGLKLDANFSSQQNQGDRADPNQAQSGAPSDTAKLRKIVNQIHKQVGFGDASPSDWWVLLLADGDGMGNYVNGRSLENYEQYLIHDLVNPTIKDKDEVWSDLLKTTKRMGPATHVGLNRALLDFSNRLVPHLIEHRYCGRVIYSGGDDVMAALPLADLPGGVRSLRAAWSGKPDPEGEFESRGDYWWAKDSDRIAHLPQRPLFTMGWKATMSMGIVIAHKSVPLPMVLESLWEAESDRAKKLLGGGEYCDVESSSTGDMLLVDTKPIPPKDGLCFRVIYGSGNTLEALMKGHLLDLWWEMVRACTCDADALQQADLSPVLNRLAEELPNHVMVTENDQLCRVATVAIVNRRDEKLDEETKTALLDWVEEWERWAWNAQQTANKQDTSALGASINDLANLLKFTAFWVTRRRLELSWTEKAREVSHV
ncbi:MAG: type III-B CRISPR-associated protein Cas10/Cmr2 [Cyanothece sp. SIO2G6]|nr:type III-B CRISPR-associated protein Cas10/Cmr2 [Cyanothece sp. SIO2G6]